MKKIALLGLCFCSLIFSAVYANAAEESLDQIVATVNDEVVTTSELNHSMMTARMQLAQEHAPTPSDAALKKQVLDQLINKKLQLQLAKQAGITATDSDLNKAINHIANQNHLTVNQLYERLSSEGMSIAEYKSEMREQILLTKLQQQEVVSHITVSPQEIDRFMHSHPWQSNNNEYHLEDILIPLSDTPSRTEVRAAKAHASEVFAKLNQGEDVKALTQQMPALQSGDLGWLKPNEIPSAFASKVVNMHLKQIAGPIQTSNGFHIIRLADIRATDNAQPAPTRKDVENLLLRQKFEEAVQGWVSKLRSQAVIAINKQDKNPAV